MLPQHISLVKHLRATGRLPAAWQATVEAVPRHPFIPDLVWTTSSAYPRPGRWVGVDRDEDPRRWLTLAYDDLPLLARLGHDPATAERRELIRQPSAVLELLTCLDLDAGMRVLQAGLGTGYVAALLTHQAGGRNMTGVEPDPDVAARARRVLGGAGHQVPVLTREPARGWSRRGPYDRVLSTVPCIQVPYAWVEQTRLGGIIVTPWGAGHSDGVFLRLQVGRDGMAVGHFVTVSSRPSWRWQPTAVHSGGEYGTVGADLDVDALLRGAQASHSSVERINMAEVLSGPARLAITLALPEVSRTVEAITADGAPGTEWVMWLADPSGAWASVEHVDAERFRVTQAGRRRLWDEVRAAYEWWRDLGSPSETCWGVTVTPHGQMSWLHDPDLVVLPAFSTSLDKPHRTSGRHAPR